MENPSHIWYGSVFDPFLDGFEITEEKQQFQRLRALLDSALDFYRVKYHFQVSALLEKFNNQLDLETPDKTQVIKSFVSVNNRGKRFEHDVGESLDISGKPHVHIILHFSILKSVLCILDFGLRSMIPCCWIRGCENFPVAGEYMICGAHLDEYGVLLAGASSIRLSINISIPPAPQSTFQRTTHSKKATQKKERNRLIEDACEYLVFYSQVMTSDVKYWCSAHQWELNHEIILHRRLRAKRTFEYHGAQLSFSLEQNCVLFRLEGESEWKRKCSTVGCFHAALENFHLCGCHSSRENTEKLLFKIIMDLAGVSTWTQMNITLHEIIDQKIRHALRSKYHHFLQLLDGEFAIRVSDDKEHIHVARKTTGIKTYFQYLCNNYGSSCQKINQSPYCPSCVLVRCYKPFVAYSNKSKEFFFMYDECTGDDSRSRYIAKQCQYRVAGSSSDIIMIREAPELLTREESSSFILSVILYLRFEADQLGIDTLKFHCQKIAHGNLVWRYFIDLLAEANVKLKPVDLFRPKIANRPLVYDYMIPDDLKGIIFYVYESRNKITGATYSGLKCLYRQHVTGKVVNIVSRYHENQDYDQTGYKDLLAPKEPESNKIDEIALIASSVYSPFLPETVRIFANLYIQTILFRNVVVTNRDTSILSVPPQIFFHELRRCIYQLVGETFEFEMPTTFAPILFNKLDNN